MSDTDDSNVPSLESLARRYLELWQDQWAAVATDPEMADALARLLQMMGQGLHAFTPFAGAGSVSGGWDPRSPPGCPYAGQAAGHPHARHAGGYPPTHPYPSPHHDPYAGPYPAGPGQPVAAEASGHDRHPDIGAAAGAAPAGAAPVGDDVDVAQLQRRLALLEERLAALEAQPPGSGGPAPRRSRRRQS